MILAGDIGGTKTILALFEPGASAREPVAEERFPSQEAASLESLAKAFTARTKTKPTRAVFGIAGPVVDNRVEATNLPWTMDGDRVSEAIGGARVTLLNDLEATAWGLPVLGNNDLEQLQPGTNRIGNRALIAAGTGLGESIVTWEGKHWHPSPSEGGHSDFGSRNPLEDELLLWLRERFGRVSYERILSGPGLADVYRFMAATKRGAEPPEVATRFAQAKDPAAIVTETALDQTCERSALTMQLFVDIYGAEAGNLALKALAIGGLFVGGGIAPRILPFLRDGRFVRAFTAKGRLTSMLEDIPVSVILDPQTALWGAASYALAT